MNNCPCDEPPNAELEIARALNAIAAGQSALPRQVRSFPEVREALLAALPKHEALELWRARNSRDLGVMLLEMWAYVSDVLSFYDERIANETYLRTAQRAISLRRLVQLLGYIPAPGIAGSVTLATLAEGRKAIALPAGTAFRSDAFGAEPPQVFEISQPTSIHPFKNEWTIGAIKPLNLPQASPTHIEHEQRAQQQGDLFEEEIGKFLVFETLEFGLVVGRLALFNFGSSPEDLMTTLVASIRPFAGKDGKTYAEVEFNPALSVPSVPASSVAVQVPSITAVVTKFTLPGGLDPIHANPDGTTRVYLDSIYRQIRPQDLLLVTVGLGSPQIAPVRLTQELPVIVQEAVPASSGSSAIPQVTIPVTVVDLSDVDFLTVEQDRNAIQFHFAFVNGGHVTTVAETEVPPATLAQGLIPIQGIVERPPESVPKGSIEQDFLVTDPDGNGAQVAGLMVFGASGRAQISIQADVSELPAPTYRTPITVFGNVVTATRGETVFGEVLGSGDPRLPGQELRLKKKPLTYTAAANDLGRESSLQLFVDDVRWKEVQTFFHCGPTDRVYIVRHDLEQNTIITFGDGVRGSRVPSGVNNVKATYRFGAGAAAPPAGAIQQLTRPVLGLRGVRSPIGATPGKDPDPPERLRTFAPVSSRLLGRAVSPPDFQALASLEAGVTRAVADFLWLPEQQQAGVKVTYIGERKASELRQKLSQFGEVGLPIQVEQAFADAATLTLTIAAHPDFERTALDNELRELLLNPDSGPLSLSRAPIGGQFLVSPLYELLHAVPGVVAVVSISLDVRDRQGTFIGGSLDGLGFACVPTGEYFDFTAASGLEIIFVDPAGPVSASPRGGC